MLTLIFCCCAHVDTELSREDFLEITRKDIAVLIPNKFVLGMKLFKIIQKYRHVSSASTSTSISVDEDPGSSSGSSIVQNPAVKNKHHPLKDQDQRALRGLKKSAKFSLPICSQRMSNNASIRMQCSQLSSEIKSLEKASGHFKVTVSSNISQLCNFT